jgi:hypothetical protein
LNSIPNQKQPQNSEIIAFGSAQISAFAGKKAIEASGESAQSWARHRPFLHNLLQAQNKRRCLHAEAAPCM